MPRPSTEYEPRSPAQGFVLRASPQYAIHRVDAGRCGGVAVIQRFGGALNLNVHIHALVLDGVFAREGTGALRFHPTPDLTTLDVRRGWRPWSR